jgi:hypothetical protein
MDFTVKKYVVFLEQLRVSGYSFQTFEEFVRQPEKKVVVKAKPALKKAVKRSVELKKVVAKKPVKKKATATKKK